MHTKYKGYISRDIEVMSIFRNLNADFETLTQTLTSRSKSQGSKFVCVWKGLVHIHMHTKYDGYISRDIEVMSIFRNLNVDFET